MPDIFGKSFWKHEKRITIPKKKLDIDTRLTIRELRELLGRLDTSSANETLLINKEIRNYFHDVLATNALPALNMVTSGISKTNKSLLPSIHPLSLLYVVTRVEVKKASVFLDNITQTEG